VEVARAKIRDRGASSDGERIRFSSAILPLWARRTRSLDALLPVLYLRGISTGDFQEALTALLGKDAPDLSPAVVSRLTAEWQSEYERWQNRDLSARRRGRSWIAAVRSSRSAEALSLRLHQPDQVVASVGAGGRSQSGADLAAQEFDAGLSDDRQLPQGENWAALKAANRSFVLLARELGLVGEPLSPSTAPSSMATPPRRASSRAGGLPSRSPTWTGRSRLTASRLRTMTRRKARTAARIEATVMEMAAISARRWLS
jgi:Transposase, Mutator family